MTKDFQEQGLITNQSLEEYDGTTAVVRTQHMEAEEVEFLRWKAERWMKVRHMPAALPARSLVRSQPRPADDGTHLSRQHAAFHAWLGGRTDNVFSATRRSGSRSGNTSELYRSSPEKRLYLT